MKRIVEQKRGDKRVDQPRSDNNVLTRTWRPCDYDRGLERMIPKLPVYLLLSVLILGCLLVVPNDLDLRSQRLTNFLFIAMTVMGVYVLFDLSVTAGVFILFACFEAFRGINMITLTFLLCMIGLFIAIVRTHGHWQPHKGLIYDALIFIAGVNLLFQVLQLFDIYWPLYPIPGVRRMLPGLMAIWALSEAASCFYRPTTNSWNGILSREGSVSSSASSFFSPISGPVGPTATAFHLWVWSWAVLHLPLFSAGTRRRSSSSRCCIWE